MAQNNRALIRVYLKPILIFGLLISVVGCVSISYKPSLSLDQSPKTIKARALLHKFSDNSPEEDKDTKLGGVSVAEPGTIEGDLATGVTNAILSDFHNNRVFLEIEKSMEHPDVVIQGRIVRFSGKGGMNALGWFTIPISIVWLLGLQVQTVEEEVLIEVILERPDGSLIGKYLGHGGDSEDFSMYTQVALSAPSRTNNAFGVAITKIREQMIKDEVKIVQ